MYDDKFPSIQRQSYHPIKTLALDYRRPLTSICRASQKYHNKVWSAHFPLLSCAPLGKRQSPRIMIHFHQACSYGQFGWLSPTVDHASVFQDHESNTYCARPSIHSTTTSARFCLLLRSVADAAHRLLVQPLGRKRRSASLPPSLPPSSGESHLVLLFADEEEEEEKEAGNCLGRRRRRRTRPSTDRPNG